jgi:leader peptidase (prepilin peptidase) / N-methyltransferase
MTPMPILFAAFAGLLVGSFLNVVALRMPRGVSFVSGSSHCMTCESPVKPWDNIPLFSWLLLRGRCRSCGTGIAARYPLVEAGTAALAAVTVAVHHDDTAQLVLGLVLIAFLVPMALIDLEHRIIPNKLTAPAAVAAVVIGLALDPGGEPERLIAGVAGGGFFLLAALAAPGGMGMGDVKLAAVMGIFLGVSVIPALFVGTVLGGLVGFGLLLRYGPAARKHAVPFGPFLAVGGVVGLLAGSQMIDAYLNLFVR